MSKAVFIAEKPSVAKEFAKAIKDKYKQNDGYLEGERSIVTWCVGHLVNMSYPDAYDESLKKWTLEAIPFIPDTYKYQVIDDVKKQFNIVKGILTRDDVDKIYVCTDAGREGEYIYRLVDQEAHVEGKQKLRVWIDSQTEEEILRGIKEAKDISEYDNLSAAAYLRAKEDYLMGINFSRALTLRYSYGIKTFLKKDKCVVSVGRVMTCVLGMVVNREREIRDFVKTPFYRVLVSLDCNGTFYDGEFRAVEGSKYFESPVLYKENGFKKEEDANELIKYVDSDDKELNVFSVEKKKEKKNPPMLYNLADIQNDCSKYFKINPDQTLKYVQELYEKKLVTYPRTDARVLSSAVAKEIHKNLGGLKVHPLYADIIQGIFDSGSYKKIGSTKYTNDKLITDHYAIIPTGQGFENLKSVDTTCLHIYEIICRRFLGIFLPPAVYEKIALVTEKNNEKFFSSFKVLKEEGYLAATTYSFIKKKDNTPDAQSEKADSKGADDSQAEGEDKDKKDETEDVKCSAETLEFLGKLKKGDKIKYDKFFVKEGETTPPKRYNSGSMILAMESAGQQIEDEELRAQLKGSGIGTSATRAGILTKLFNNGYLNLNKKTQIITPTLLGEIINDTVYASIPSLLYPKLTASWEKGLTMVANGEVSEDEYMKKLAKYVTDYTNEVKNNNQSSKLNARYRYIAQFYKK
ncbi:MAG: type IA DNA topoisomerase [Lachnospiraceae bacterium]|nr:type IA DNA topoisomerase [Lachnospiraceae bacterium]